MQIVWRPLAPHETDPELLWLSVSIGFLACAAAWLALGLPWPQCAFYAITGHPCITCGATRSAIAFFHGNFLTAWRWNPLAFVGWCAVMLFDLYAVIVLVSRAPRLRVERINRSEKKIGRILMVALLVANWVYLLSHSSAFAA